MFLDPNRPIRIYVLPISCSTEFMFYRSTDIAKSIVYKVLLQFHLTNFLPHHYHTITTLVPHFYHTITTLLLHQRILNGGKANKIIEEALNDVLIDFI